MPTKASNHLARALAVTTAALTLMLATPVTALAGDEMKPGPPDEELCRDVAPYQGINAVPPITMQIVPSSAGDTVTNDALSPPGPEPRIVVGFWEHPDPDYKPGKDENPCQGEPTLKIAYPLSYGSQTCFGWKHWHFDAKGNLELNPNSARNFACTDGVFSYNQWTTLTCDPAGPVGEEGTPKKAYPTQCCRDNPPTIYSQILSGCGHVPAGHGGG